MASEELSKRERSVLEAVIRTYIETAEPAGSRTLSQRSGLGVSPATIRNTMSDLEEKGFLFHPHTSAGRVLTQEWGVALGPRLGLSVLRRLDLVRVSSDRLLLVLTLEGGVMRTVFVEVPGDIADAALTKVPTVLNERLAGPPLEQIRTSLGGREAGEPFIQH